MDKINPEIREFLLDIKFHGFLDNSYRVQIANLYKRTRLHYKYPLSEFVKTFNDMVKVK